MALALLFLTIGYGLGMLAYDLAGRTWGYALGTLLALLAVAAYIRTVRSGRLDG